MKARPVLLTCASAGALAIAGAGVWVSASQISARDCESQEADDYPRLEKVAQEVAGEVGDRVRRYSFCEEAGIPGAAVRVSVYDWRNRAEARDFLRGLPIADPYSGAPGSTDKFSVRGVVIQYMKSGDHLETTVAASSPSVSPGQASCVADCPLEPH